MADICDLAQDHYERTMSKAMENIALLSQKPEALVTGFCLSCEEKLAKISVNPRFCDAQCRDDYDARSKKKSKR